jgi:NADH-ubiquinone oxidoreductase chain 6
LESLFLLVEKCINGYSTEVLDFISLFAILSGILVIISKNPIVSVLFLIGLFASISCYLLMIGLTFLGLSYLIVYIGAVSILFLFILMLINIRISELQSDTNNSIFLAIAIAISFNSPLFQLLPFNIAILNNFSGLESLNLFMFNISLARTQKPFGFETLDPSFEEKLYYVTSNS